MHEELKKLIPEVKENEILAPYTTFKIGGPARYFFVAHTSDDVVKAVQAAKEYEIPFFVLGGASNILVSDKGFDGLVIVNKIQGFTAYAEGNRIFVTVGAGESWDETVARCVSQNWSGIECLSGIPGTVGATPVQNIGAYGQSVDAVIKEVRAIDSRTWTEAIFDREACQFGYRTSMFKKNSGHFIITQVTFALTPGGRPTLSYHDLKNYFTERPAPTLLEIRQAVIEIRARKGYVIMPGYESYQTAGSFFMNPIITQEQFQKLKPLIKECPDPWYWPLPDERVKVSAACLLQSAGFHKGYRKGNTGISLKHSLSLVNFGGASAQEVMAFAEEIKKRVQEKFGIALEEEVELVGF
ncbi:UDP-N-acetylenolpyruvoylglucosamine reductase [Candidatus Uhrbacteria bacterium RIFCSPLOWO2_01_FULL_47_24]|uniref:UDP-N-acetylenolpyruvoylglucosamine reductase n=1 Tax=Candidatus Uhrbacteria bacterium RIFCSPLOWO2_01_FULL_47_24 TaxID=1802401 RepID=A0A1F7UQC0_9BACT|nr:MAG: UDP-N-acetylenolpyruvoylglucosamine reductase [Candidatus Uhrbacteria bacterium RIFCSPHIGHO2_01_FULL_47_11]OGL67672.1 MAG: UDP-N-acetylenolpyruvoylglucosamine reductase [Candidatus Uhrbacteria bacterium RIFCSPHIGHO2_02_FULL_46_47]OGL74855.1 MAG: UDP-N-acetylenolpyruvoylglucosamine reductase [Candidatus Uhrbacteria bacterium RIFCSPHIGHO2_12_FULL_47_11]OGL79877.1 MAG: UDP-N-acetylenolpyruvoylglucosamine reductase [Candidatus Uhrbacteria bacterium RIFCSPLOWO2_01_FULL_47_24]OGL84097.1 MAG: 